MQRVTPGYFLLFSVVLFFFKYGLIVIEVGARFFQQGLFFIFHWVKKAPSFKIIFILYPLLAEVVHVFLYKNIFILQKSVKKYH